MSRQRASSIRSAKLSQPRIDAGWLQRPELQARLTLDRTHAWISGPAACGKTVFAALAARQIADAGGPVAWLQIEPEDDDPGSLFHHLSRAVKVADGDSRRAAALPVFGRAVGADIEDFARAWFRALHVRWPKGGTVVLDDWHHIDGRSPLQKVLLSAMDMTLPGLALWVTSRFAPASELVPVRARGRMKTFGFADLALDRDEVAKLMSADSETSERWLRWSEGWIGVLVFARIAGCADPGQLPAPLPEDSDGASFGPLFAFLADELMSGCTLELCEFIYVTVHMPSVDAQIASRVLPHCDVGRCIDALTRTSLLLAHDGGPKVGWRYHRVLRTALQHQMQVHWPERDRGAVLSRLAAELGRAGQIEAAHDLHISLGERPQAVALLLREAPQLLRDGRYQVLRKWCEAVPEPERTAWVEYWLGHALLASSPRQGLQHFERAFSGFWLQRDPAGLYESWCGVVESITYACDDYGALELWLQRLRDIRQQFGAAPSWRLRVQTVVYGFSATFFLRPQAPEFAGWLRSTRRFYRLLPRRADRAAIGGLLGLYHASISGMGGLSAHLHTLRPLLEDPAVPPFHRLVGGLSDVIHHWVGGNLPAAASRLALYEQLARDTGAHAIDRQFAFQRVYVYLLSGDLEAADAFLRNMAMLPTELGELDRAQYDFLAGWRAALGGRTQEALSLLRDALGSARQRRFAFFASVSGGLLAELLALDGRHDDARREIGAAWETAQSMGSVTALVPCGFQRAVVVMLGGASTVDQAHCIREAMGMARRHGHKAWGGLYPPTLALVVHRALEMNTEPELARELVRVHRLAPPPSAAWSANWPRALVLRGLGPLAIVLDGAPWETGGKQAQRPLDLLRAMICAAPAPLSVSTALAWLWPHTEGADVRKAFDVSLHRLRRLLGDDELVQLEGGKLRLHPQRAWTDVHALAAALAEPGKASPALLRDLVRGRLLEGDNASWIQHARDMWRWRVAAAVNSLPASQQPPLLRDLFAVDPASEPLARQLAAHLRELGEHGQARGVMALCSESRSLGDEPPLRDP